MHSRSWSHAHVSKEREEKPPLYVEFVSVVVHPCVIASTRALGTFGFALSAAPCIGAARRGMLPAAPDHGI